ncbi:MAG: aromatic amino acid hydroxylase [Deltaproteobacteria bacterium]|nr:aromatic amino acid hydroxylase [Deltaproteobacteria bacterium]
MHRTIANLPAYLQKYCVEQQPTKYSSRDHAGWRYIMRQSTHYFKEHAVPIYLEGLRRTGITTDRIPHIAEMDARLRELGWGAVPVQGFIPPAAFLDFQARRILPIASDMRSVDHIHYTPAPDIVHEAAGHAPILANPEYSEYLQMYAAMAKKAIFSGEDLKLYEAIRRLSDVKENPDCTPRQIEEAQAALQAATAAITYVSEAAKVARMNWWTVEYGLIGDLKAPKIYGAGLLSSVGESQSCLSAKVKKLRLTLACIDTSYDITEPQPQLFVAEDINHLKAVLLEFEQSLSYRRGGKYAIEQGIAGATVTTTTLDSGIEISGVLAGFAPADHMEVAFMRWQGPVQLAIGGSELPGQSTAHHPSGFSTPLGRAQSLSDRPLSKATDSDLQRLGIKVGSHTTLMLTSGFQVTGQVASILRRDSGDLVIIKWKDCTVKRGEDTYFEPSWGDFDMAVGELVTAVAGGPSDAERYGAHDVGTAESSPARTSPFTSDEIAIFQAYDAVRQLRDQVSNKGDASRFVARLKEVAAIFSNKFPDEWLLHLEIIELARQLGVDLPANEMLLSGLVATAAADKQWLIRQGLALAAHHA